MCDYGSKRLNAGFNQYAGDKSWSVLPTLSDGPIHAPGGRDHSVKGWVPRRTEQMVFLWCTCREQINPWFGGIMRNFIGYQLELKVIVVYLDLCTFSILTLAVLIIIHIVLFLTKKKSFTTAPSSCLVTV